jgi:PAS domain S-box-containing protein
MYAKFLIEILNDKEGGQDLLSRAKDATNIKQNYYDANNMHEDLSDISAISANGTPCIYVTGENDKIGMVTLCNAGACRIFGYTSSEIKNHNVEKLMPEMYAKNHSKILDDALAKGAENIPNKERLVFARHKSGYIFPVWLQLKMI